MFFIFIFLFLGSSDAQHSSADDDGEGWMEAERPDVEYNVATEWYRCNDESSNSRTNWYATGQTEATIRGASYIFWTHNLF